MQLYPLKFSPLLKYRIWGGSTICKLKQLPADTKKIGESWEISDRPENNSVVSNGKLKGKSFQDLREEFSTKLLGTTLNPNKPFPLLIKILDAREDLSLQVHPPKKILNKLPNNAQSKDEFWYILNGSSGEVMIGLNRHCSKKKFIDNIDKDNLKKCLNLIPTQPHMLFQIESGTLHAIGKNNLILEIQENSDTTYRVSDWGRLENGKPRTLHKEESLLAINFSSSSKPLEVAFQNNYQVLNNHFCEVFSYYLTETRQMFTNKLVCEIISVTSGSVTVSVSNNSNDGFANITDKSRRNIGSTNSTSACSNDESFTLNMGESCFIPASVNYKITPTTTTASVLITIPKPNH
ncbi:mannose-6-phosphate isomerase [Candidatus Hepatincola sp. Av]